MDVLAAMQSWYQKCMRRSKAWLISHYDISLNRELHLLLYPYLAILYLDWFGKDDDGGCVIVLISRV